jgi:hypothetical protein
MAGEFLQGRPGYSSKGRVVLSKATREPAPGWKDPGRFISGNHLSIKNRIED